MHLPDTVAQAATLAAVQEHLNEKVKSHPRKFFPARPDNKTGGDTVDLWKARQLKEYRRANNLCFKCGEKYTPAHTCKSPEGALQLIEQATLDGGEYLSEDILDRLDQPHLQFMQEDCYLFLHALCGQPQHRAIQLRALVKKVLVILIDYGSSHIFLNSVLTHKLQATTTSLSPMLVKVANGASLSCNAEVKNFECWVQGYTFQVDAKDLGCQAH
jgi:hypothetical protein